MAVDMFLKLDGVTGEAKAKAHAGEIDILSWSIGAHQTGTADTGGGNSAGRVSISELTVSKVADKSSPTLFLLCCSGKHIATGEIAVRKAGGDDALEYVKIPMEEIQVTGFRTTGSDGDVVVEEVSLTCTRVGYVYTPQAEDGSGEASTGHGWNQGDRTPWSVG